MKSFYEKVLVNQAAFLAAVLQSSKIDSLLGLILAYYTNAGWPGQSKLKPKNKGLTSTEQNRVSNLL
jgi:hypothetical protein